MEQHASAGTASVTVATVGGVPLRRGDHLCAFYRGRAERDRLVTPFLADGLRKGHACTLLAAPDEGRAYRDALAAEVPPLGPAADRLLVRDPRDVHQRNGVFDGAFGGASEGAFDGDGAGDGSGNRRPGLLRIAADMSWAHPLVRPDFVRELVEHETRATSWLRACPQVGLCMYDLELFGGDLIIPMVKAHPRVWLGGMVVENPYYLGQGLDPGPGAGPAGTEVS
ncbi:MEDS domain-containing protein [Streptomyces sp. NPDC088354]|uniref:MEDS domain-containing protein n=1 Tax=Streptomyces sp. NPDC088354 TaxID=3365856 RepID=UPI00382374EF